MAPFRHILVATDFSPTAERAVDLAVAMAKQCGAALTLLHVTDIPGYAYKGVTAAPRSMLGPVHRAAEASLAQALSALQAQLPEARSMLRPGSGGEEIVAAAAEAGADLVVVGTHGRSGVRQLLMGSVAERVVRTSPVPVLSVRGAA